MRGLVLPGAAVGAIVLIALITPLLPLSDPVAIDIGQRLALPGSDHWLGRDDVGRDVLSRLLWGARPSLALWPWGFAWISRGTRVIRRR